MNERTKILVLLGLIFLVAGGGGFYFLIYGPLQERNTRITRLESDIAEQDAEIRDIERKLPELDRMQKRSLPSDVEFARREYEVELNSLMRRSGFNMANVRIEPRPASSSGAPELTKGKPAYTRLEYGVTVPEVQTSQLVRFLESFYRYNLLHQIRTLNVSRSLSAARRTGSSRGDEEAPKTLSLRMTVEAIVLDRAEDRASLLPDTEAVSAWSRLAKESREYTRILEKDPFFGPPPPPIPESPREAPPPPPPGPEPFDVGPYMRLTGITFQDVQDAYRDPALEAITGPISNVVPEFSYEYATADLYDRYHNRAYTIGMAFDGISTVAGYIFEVGEDGRKKEGILESFMLEFIEDGKKRRYEVVRIDPTSILLQEPVSVKERNARASARASVFGVAPVATIPKEVPPTYRWRIGDDFSKIESIPADEARVLLKIPAGLAVVTRP